MPFTRWSSMLKICFTSNQFMLHVSLTKINIKLDVNADKKSTNCSNYKTTNY